MAHRRGTGQLLSTPHPSLETANQNQIDDLVQRNRTLEHKIQMLSNELEQEASRSKSAIEAVQESHVAEQQKWKEALTDLLGTYRVVQSRLEVEVQKERVERLKEMEAVRRERKEKAKWEYKLRLWIMEGEELKRKLEDAEAEIEEMSVRDQESLVAMKAEKERTKRLEKELKTKDKELALLREKHANLTASHSTFDTKVERLQLNNNLLTTQKQDLNKELVEEKKKTADLNRQLEHWQNLDSKEDNEIQVLKRKIQALELEEKPSLEAQLNKEKSRVEKSKIVVAQWEVRWCFFQINLCANHIFIERIKGN